MKNATIGILLIATMVFGGLYVQQNHEARQAQAAVDNLHSEISELQFTLKEEERRAARSRHQLEKTRIELAAKAEEAARVTVALQQNLTNQPDLFGGTNAKPANPFAEIFRIFKNPEIKRTIESEQKAALSAVVEKNYTKLFSELNLTLEQSSVLKNLILNKQLEALDTGMSILSDDPGTTNRANLVQQVKATSDAGDAQIKAFLGDDKFAQLQTYEKSIGERMAVGDFKDQLGTGPNALNDAQGQQLIQVMTEERQNFKFTTDFSDESKFTDEFVSLVTEDKMKGYLQELSQLDQQYLMRARGILSPDQLAEFEKYLNTQQRLQTAGMQITVKLGDH